MPPREALSGRKSPREPIGSRTKPHACLETAHKDRDPPAEVSRMSSNTSAWGRNSIWYLLLWQDCYSSYLGKTLCFHILARLALDTLPAQLNLLVILAGS